MQPLKPFYFSGVFVGLFLIGCSGGSDADQVDIYGVSGKITMSGSPVANATVTFSPKEKQPLAMARTDANGQYTLTTNDANDGAAAGDYIVLVTKSAPGAGGDSESAMHEAMNSGKDANAAMHDAAKAAKESASLLPEKYSIADQSDLNATVKTSGKNEFNFELKP